MIRKFAGLTSLGFLALFLCGQMPPPLRDLPQSRAPSLSGQEIGQTSQGVYIRVVNRPLQEMLQYIQPISGVQFSLPSSMLTVPVTTTIEAPDWPTAIRQLLLPFNTAAVWDEGNTQLRQVFILESDTPPPGMVFMPRSSPGDVPQPEATDATAQ